VVGNIDEYVPRSINEVEDETTVMKKRGKAFPDISG